MNFESGLSSLSHFWFIFLWMCSLGLYTGDRVESPTLTPAPPHPPPPLLHFRNCTFNSTECREVCIPCFCYRSIPTSPRHPTLTPLCLSLCLSAILPLWRAGPTQAVLRFAGGASGSAHAWFRLSGTRDRVVMLLWQCGCAATLPHTPAFDDDTFSDVCLSFYLFYFILFYFFFSTNFGFGFWMLIHHTCLSNQLSDSLSVFLSLLAMHLG